MASRHMRDYCGHFYEKKITLMGLGLLGRGVGVAKFLAECGAELIVTDLKTKEQLAPSLKKLARFKNIRYVLGEHRLEDFRSADMVIKAAGVPLDSSFIAEARRRGVSIKMDASLFAELAPEDVLLVGVTGTRGKSTTTQLIYEILSQGVVQRSKVKGQRFAHPRVFLGGNMRGLATLPLLRRVRGGDIVVLELDSWQLQGFGESKISPHVAVFTTFFDDHLNYYGGDRARYFNDKANIFAYQSGVNNFQFSISNFQSNLKFQKIKSKTQPTLIVGEQAASLIHKNFPGLAKHMIVARPHDIPKNWKLVIPGEHNRYNAACALRAADALGVPRAISKRVITTFRGLPGRLEFVRELRGVKIYNDTCATTPEATIAALRTLGDRPLKAKSYKLTARKIVLVMGGSDKGLDMAGLFKEIPKYCKTVVLLGGAGARRLLEIENCLPAGAVAKAGKLKILPFVQTLQEAVVSALSLATKGDVVLFSPAFASFGMFKNEFDRGEKFVRTVRALR